MSYDVRFWAIRRNSGRKRPWEVRWVVAGRPKSRSFVSRALAVAFLADLTRAARAGEEFDPTTGLPIRQARDVSWYRHAVSYVDMKWPRAAATTRKSMAEALTTATMALLTPKRGRPDDRLLRRALYAYAFNPVRRAAGVPDDVTVALQWLEKASAAVSSLRDAATVRRLLDALTVTLKGRPAAATTVYRKRGVVYNALGFAVECGLLSTNPIDAVQWTAPEVATAVDRRVVANPEQVRRILAAVTSQGAMGRQLVGFFACMYFAGMRPGEVMELRAADCNLPEIGWGRLDLHSNAPSAGKAWTDDGQQRQRRGLKHRGRREVRPVPIPPELVAILGAHLDEYGSAPDGRLFRTRTNRAYQDSHYTAVWRKARELALSPGEVASPLAARPYDLRHGAATLWLNAGVPPTEVARRLGQGVAVLLKVYANCIDGETGAVNARIEAKLGDPSGSGTLVPGDAPASAGNMPAAGQSRDTAPDGTV